MMKTLSVLAFAALLATESFGVDAVWQNTATTAQDWHTAANWKDSQTGATLAEPPTNAVDAVVFPAVDKKVRTVNLSAPSADWRGEVASVTGGDGWSLCFNRKGNGSYSDYFETFSFGDVNGFTGEWTAVGGKKTLRLAAAGGTQTLTTVSVAGQFAVEVANAATTAEIETLKGTAGSLKKSGPGDLRVREGASSGNLVLELEEGDVRIDGRMKDPSGAVQEIAQKSALWLDASAQKTWQAHTYTDDSGRTRVTNWKDAAGRDISACIWDNSGDKTDSHIKDIKPPFISTRTSSTGLALMDFGTNSSTSDDLPQALMQLTEKVQVQEAFIIAEVDSGYHVIGDKTDYSFASSEAYVFTYGEAITNNGGFACFNGAHKTPDLTLVGSTWRVPRQTDDYSPTKKNSLQLTDVCFGEGTTKPVSLIASDRIYKSNSGGVRIGEVLLFTAKLTDAERAKMTEYLMGKWFAPYNRKDFDTVSAADGTSITVPAGQVARINTLRVKGTSFVKKGAGHLEIGRVFPEDLAIRVEGGDLSVVNAVKEDQPNSPAGTPQLWFDANDANAFVTDGDHVTAWKDCRGNGKQATRLTFDQVTAYPSADTTRVSGKTVLTFPDKAAFQMPGDGASEVFVAFCYTDTPGQLNVIAEGYKTDRRQGGVDYLFAAPAVGYEYMAGGTFSVDGKPVRPFEPAGDTFVKDQWRVIHLSTPTKSSLQRLASNGPRSQLGKVSYGEVVTYDTNLSPSERAATIDYLMNKWLGKRHPEYAQPAADVSLAFDGAATIAGETDMTIASVTGAGSFSKTGDGHATVTADLTDAFTDIAVLGGSLTIAKPTEPQDHSIFHFDASDASTFEDFYVDANGETNVQKIVDVRRNGTTASTPAPFSPSSGNMFYVTNPIVRFAEFAPGVRRPYFDCLTYTGRNVTPATGAGFYVSPMPGKTATKEVHAVMATHAAVDVFWGRTNVDFKRGLSNRLFRYGSESAAVSTDVSGGYISVDNVAANYSAVLENDTFHLVSLAPLSGKDVATIGIDRNNYSGGSCYAEIMTFSDYLTAKERAYLQDKLMYKWFNKGTSPIWENELSSVTLTSDTLLTVEGGAIAVPMVTGGGTISASKVLGLSTLNLATTGRTAVDCLTVEGEAGFAASVTVNLSGDQAAHLKVGRYPVITATALSGLDLTNWTVTPAQDRPVAFVCEGNTVYLDVKTPGLLMVVR